MEPIVVETKMTFQDMKRFMQFTMFRKGKGFKPSIIVLIVALAVAVIALLGMVLTVGLEGFSFQLITMLLLIPFILVLMLLMPTINAKTVQKTSGALFESMQRYILTVENFQVETSGQHTAGNGTYRYEAFHKVCETADSFYLYLNAQQAYLLPKRDVPPDQLAALTTLLVEQMGKKYIKCF